MWGATRPMEPTPLQLERACALLVERGIDRSYAAFVAQHLRDFTDGWRWCCSSNCDPCVQGLAAVVDQLRAESGIAPPAD
ncbi:MAG: hypothetical protein RL148_1786 [Planctomycetota bacterium]